MCVCVCVCACVCACVCVCVPFRGLITAPQTRGQNQRCPQEQECCPKQLTKYLKRQSISRSPGKTSIKAWQFSNCYHENHVRTCAKTLQPCCQPGPLATTYTTLHMICSGPRAPGAAAAVPLDSQQLCGCYLAHWLGPLLGLHDQQQHHHRQYPPHHQGRLRTSLVSGLPWEGCLGIWRGAVRVEACCC